MEASRDSARHPQMSVGGGHDAASLRKANAMVADHPATDELNHASETLFRLDSLGFVWDCWHDNGSSKPSRPLLREAEPPLRTRPRKPRDPGQPRLPFDFMPDRIEPCLALSVAKPPKGPEWVYEIKWDGYRLAIHIEPQSVRILTRGGHNWTHRFPAIADAARKIGGTAILDGEAVVLDEAGRSDFGALQQALGGRGGKPSAGEAIFYAFDLLYFDGHDLRQMALSERRQMLSGLVNADAGVMRLSEEIDGDGDVLLTSACEHGLEGIIAKRLDAPYHSDRRGDWVKIKCIQSDSFFIVGYESSAAALGGMGRLMLAARREMTSSMLAA